MVTSRPDCPVCGGSQITPCYDCAEARIAQLEAVVERVRGTCHSVAFYPGDTYTEGMRDFAANILEALEQKETP